MIENSRTLSLRLLALSALALAAACNVSASGQIPCADDSSCPASYPVCKSGFCVESSGPVAAASASIVGVPGKSATDPIRGTVDVQVIARAASGVKSVSLAGGGKTFAPAISASPMYTFHVDTTTLGGDGSIPLTATVTPGDSSQAAVQSAAFNLVVDNTAPQLSTPASGVGALTPANARAGVLVTMDVKPNEPLSRLAVTVFDSNSEAVGLMSDIAAAASDGTHHLGFALTATSAAGTYSVQAVGTDLAGNANSPQTLATFKVFPPFSFGASPLALSTPPSSSLVTESVGGLALPAISAKSGHTTLHGILTLPLPAAQIQSTTFTFGGVATGAPVAGSSFDYDTSAVATDTTDGIATVTATVTDIAGNSATITSSFIIDKTPPSVIGDAAGITIAPAPAPNNVPLGGIHQPIAISFATNEIATSVNVTVNGNAASCNSGDTNVLCTYVPTLNDNSASNPPASFPVHVQVGDVVGNVTLPALAKSVTIDNQPPGLGAQPVLPATGVTQGSQVTLCVCPSENLSSLVGEVDDSGGGLIGVATELSALAAAGACTTPCSATPIGGGNGGAFAPRQLSFIMPAAAPTGSYTFKATGTDQAGNPQAYSPGFSANGTFSITAIATSQNPGLVSGAPAFMGNASGQYSCEVGSTGKTGQITVQFNSGGATLKTPLDSTGGVVITLKDSAGTVFTLPGTASVNGANIVTLSTCIPATKATVLGGGSAGFVSSAADGVATVSVLAKDASGSTSNILNTPIFIKSAAPALSNGSATALVGPQATTLTVSFTVNELPTSGPVVTIVIPNSTTGNTHNISGTPTPCSVSGLTFTCTYTLSTTDKSFTGSGAVTINAGTSPVSPTTVTTDIVGNESTPLPITGTTYVGTLPTINGSVSSGTNTDVPGVTSAAANGQHLVFTGTANTGASIGLSGATISTSDASGTGSCTVNGSNFTCTWNVNKTGCTTNAGCTGETLTISLTDHANNVSSPGSPILTPGFTISNVLPVVAQPTLSPGTTIKGGASITYVANLTTLGTGRTLSKATIASGTAPGSGSCAITGATQVTCLWTDASSTTPGTTSSGNTVTIAVKDDLLNSGSVTTTGGTAYAVDNTVPGIGTPTVKNISALAQTSPVSGIQGQVLQFTATVSGLGTGRSVKSATLAIGAVANNASCTATGTNGTTVTCTATINTNTPSTGNTATITAVDDIGNSTGASAASAPFSVVNNTAPGLGALTISNAAIPGGATFTTIPAALGQTVRVQATSTKQIFSATITGTDGTGSCSGQGTTALDCSYVIKNTGNNASATATIALTDAYGATNATAGTASINVYNGSATLNTGTSGSTLTTSPAVGLPATQVTFSLQFNDGTVGLNPATLPTVTVGGRTGTGAGDGCTTAATGFPNTVTYTCKYTFTANSSESPANAATVPVIVTYPNILGTSATSQRAISSDLTAALLTSTTYTRTPGLGASASGTATLSPGNGTTTICAFGSSTAATSATDCSTGVAQTAVSATGPYTISIAESGSTPAGPISVRAFDTPGLGSAVSTSAGRTVVLNFQNPTGANTDQAFGNQFTTNSPTTGSTPTSITATATSVTTTVQSGAQVVVGSWETPSVSGSAPGARNRPAAAYDASTHTFVVVGGADSSGLPVFDQTTYKFDPTTKTWSSVSAGASVDTGTCTGARANRFDAGMTAASGTFFINAGRCVTSGGAQAALSDFYGWPGTGNWIKFGAGTGTPSSGPVGGLVTIGSATLFTFGFDSGTNGNVKVQQDVVTTSAGPAYSAAVTTPGAGGDVKANRYGAGEAVDPAATTQFWTFGGFLSTTTQFAAGTASQAAFEYDSVGIGFTNGPSGPPTARGYMAMAGTTSGAGTFVYGGIAAECTTANASTAGVPLFGSSEGCTNATQQPLDDLYTLTSSAWTQVQTGPSGAGIGRLAAEAGGSVHGFYDSTTNRFWVYRPTVQAVNSFPLVQSPAVLLKFDASNAAVSVKGSQVNSFTLSLTASSQNASGSSLGTKVFLYQLAGAGSPQWVDETANFISGSLVLVGTTAQNFFGANGNTLWVLVQPGTLNPTFDYKSITLSAPSLSISAN